MMNPNNGEILVMSAKEINKETGEVKDISTGNFRSGRNWFYFKSGYIIYRI